MAVATKFYSTHDEGVMFDNKKDAAAFDLQLGAVASFTEALVSAAQEAGVTLEPEQAQTMGMSLGTKYTAELGAFAASCKPPKAKKEKEAPSATGAESPNDGAGDAEETSQAA